MRCSINCSYFANAFDRTPYDPSSCLCIKNFTWSASWQICMPSCSVLAHTIPAMSANSNGMCACAYGFAPINMRTCLSDCNVVCRIDCSLFQYATYPLSNYEGCNCQKGLIWDAIQKACLADCVADNFSTKVRLMPMVCGCIMGYSWNMGSMSCLRNN